MSLFGIFSRATHNFDRALMAEHTQEGAPPTETLLAEIRNNVLFRFDWPAISYKCLKSISVHIKIKMEYKKAKEMNANVYNEARELLKSQSAPRQLPVKEKERTAAAITSLDGDFRKQQHIQQSIGQPQRKSTGGNQTSQPISSECIRAPHFHPPSNMASSLSERSTKEDEHGDKLYEER